MARVQIAPDRMQRIYAYANLTDQMADPEVSATVESLADAAIEYLGIPYSADSKLYELALKGLVAHWYDNRDAISPSSMTETPLGLRQIINKLKSRPISSVPDSGTKSSR